jgi:hypothetical protein
MAAPVSEFVITSIEDARHMLHWLTKRRRISLSGLVKTAGMRSNSLVLFANLDESIRTRTHDTNLGLILQAVGGNDHRVIVRPAGGAHLKVRIAGAVPLEIRGADGGLLEIALDSVADTRALGRTMEVVNNCSLSAICSKAGVSLSFVSFVSGFTEQNDLRLRPFLEVLLAAGFELVVQPRFANAREARFTDKTGVR